MRRLVDNLYRFIFDVQDYVNAVVDVLLEIEPELEIIAVSGFPVHSADLLI